MTELILRNYQQRMYDETKQAMRQGHRVIVVQSPTGSGKTPLAVSMIQSALSKGHRVGFNCHRKELLDQANSTFNKFGIKPGIIAAGYRSNYTCQAQISSIGTLKNRLDKLPARFKVMIWDEAHHIMAKTWRKIFDYYHDCYHLLFTATPIRGDGQGLGDIATYMVKGPSVDWLIDQGYLARYKMLSTPMPEREGFHTRAGEFVHGEVEDAMGKPKISGDILKYWLERSHDKLTIGFAKSIKLSEQYAEMFRKANIPAAHIDGNTDKKDRVRMLRDLAKGNLRVIWNVGLFGEGYDIAANSGMDVTIGCVIDASPTQSLANWLQRCGRGLRPQEGFAQINDHAGNLGQHGLPCLDREWSLDASTGKPKDGPVEMSMRQCPKCHHPDKGRPSTCSECGYVYPVMEKTIQHDEQAELEEVDIDAARQQQRQEVYKAKTKEELDKIARARGYKGGYADHVMRAREEKTALRRELYNLYEASERLGLRLTWSTHELNQLKPKALKERISEVKGLIKQEQRA